MKSGYITTCFSVTKLSLTAGGVELLEWSSYFLESNQHKVTLSTFKHHISCSVKSGLLEREK